MYIRVTGSEENCYTPITINPDVQVGNDEALIFTFSKVLQLGSITELRKTKEGHKAALEAIKEVFVKKGYTYKDAILLSLAKLVHGKSGVSEHTKTIEHSKNNFMSGIPY